MNSRQRRGVILLLLSVLCALAAFAGVLVVIGDVNSKVGSEVVAYRVKGDIAPYSPLAAGQFEEVKVPKRWLSDTAVTDLGALQGKIALTTLKRGSLLQSDMFVDKPQLQAGEQEIAIMIDAATGVAGKITSGAKVNILATFKGAKDTDPARSVIIVANARVLGVGKLTALDKDSDRKGPAEAVPITFALNTKDTQRVAYAESFAEHVRLALVAPGTDSTPARATARTPSTGTSEARMTTRILPAAGDPDAARAIVALLSQLPDAEPAAPVPDSTTLLDTLFRLAADSLDELPEVVLVHERIGPVPALELIREVALRFPAVGVVLISSDAGPALFSAAMDSGARGLIGLPLAYEELAARVQAAAQWSAGVRRHLGRGPEAPAGPGGRVVTVTGAKGAWAPRSPRCSSRWPPPRRAGAPPWWTWTSRPGTWARTSTCSSGAPSPTSPASRTSRRASSRTPSTRTAPAWPCCWPRRTGSGARRSTNGPPGTSSAPCATATSSSSSTAAPR